MDSTIVKDATDGINLLWTAITAVGALVSFIAGRVHALRKRKK